MSKEIQNRVNENIHAPEVRLIDANGEQVGIVGVKEALQRAEELGLDLVEISPNAKPPVCRVMDFGKFLFEQKKKKHTAKKKQHSVRIKELKYRPGIEESDYQVKLKKLIKFLEDGDKVKVTMRYRGREVTHHELGVNLLQRIQADLGDQVTIEQEPKFEGRQVVMVVASKKNK